jgi:hypothetical protein
MRVGCPQAGRRRLKKPVCWPEQFSGAGCGRTCAPVSTGLCVTVFSAVALCCLSPDDPRTSSMNDAHSEERRRENKIGQNGSVNNPNLSSPSGFFNVPRLLRIPPEIMRHRGSQAAIPPYLGTGRWHIFAHILAQNIWPGRATAWDRPFRGQRLAWNTHPLVLKQINTSRDFLLLQKRS